MELRVHEPYETLKLALAGKGVTYSMVGAAIGVTETTVQFKINGKSDFYLSEMRTICEKWGIDMSAFFADFVA